VREAFTETGKHGGSITMRRRGPRALHFFT
jgi:hypothetical protein